MRAEVAKGVAMMAQNLTASIPKTQAFHLFLQGLSMMGAQAGAIMEADPAAGGRLVVRLSFGLEGVSNKVIHPSPTGRTALIEALVNDKPITVLDYATENSYRPSDLEEWLGVTGAMIVPIPKDASPSPVGVVALWRWGNRDFGVEIDELRTLVEPLGYYLRIQREAKERLFQQTNDTRPPIEGAANFWGGILESETLEEVCDKALAISLKQIGAEFGFAGYIDKETGYLMCPTMTRDIYHLCRVAGKTVVFEKPSGLGGLVLDEAKTVLVNDPSSHPSSVGTPPGHIPIREFLGVPALFKGRKMGMLALANKEGGFKEDDRRLLEEFAAVFAATLARIFLVEEAKSARDEFERLYNEAPFAYYTIQRDGVISQINQTAQIMLGLKQEDRILFEDLVSPQSLDQWHKQLKIALTGIEPPSCELELKSPGGLLPVLHRIKPQADERGVIDHFHCMAIDITNERELRRKEHEAMEALQDLNRNLEERVATEVKQSREKEMMLMHQSRQAAMGEMLSNIAHHWRQPIAKVAAIIQEIQDAWRFGELEENNLATLSASALHILTELSSVIDKFSTFFEPQENDKAELADVARVVERSLSLLKVGLESDDIRLSIDIVETGSIRGPWAQLAQALLNILTNAREACLRKRQVKTGYRGYIAVRVLRNNNEILIEIENNGGAIDSQIAERIFEPYFSTKKKNEGAGLGLYTAKLIIERQFGGRIAFENLDSERVKFTIGLPHG
ncbi:MAG: GAF domain-containing protein [Campylobacterales bacterium]